MKNNLNKWTVENSYNKGEGSTSLPQWPHEILVKIFSSKAYSQLTHDLIPLNRNYKVLEIGCMGANNLRFFQDKGCSIFGVETTNDLINCAREKILHWGGGSSGYPLRT